MGLAGRADYIEAVSSRWSLYYFVEETIGFVQYQAGGLYTILLKKQLDLLSNVKSE